MLIIPDNTVLVKFARINRVDVLERMLAGKAQWTATVQEECARSADYPGLSELHQVPGFMGEPLYLATPKEWTDMRAIREKFMKPGDGPTSHLGESESLAIILNRDLGATFVTDDKSAYSYAADNDIGCLTTWDALKLAVRTGLIDVPAGWGYVLTLEGNLQRYTQLQTEEGFATWCMNGTLLDYLP